MSGRFCWVVVLGFSLLPLASAQTKPQSSSKRSPAAAPTVETSSEERGRETERDETREREQWFYRQRAFPFKRIPPGARARALQRVEEMRRAERQRGFIQAPGTAEAISANTMTWTPIGPQPSQSDPLSTLLQFRTSGRIAAVAVDPTNANVVYVGGAQGGVWKSTDAGANWTPLTDDQPSLAIGALAIDTSTASCAVSGPCQVIYAGTGEQVFSGDSYYGAGILKSIDGGMTWTQLPGSFVGPFGSGNLSGGAMIGSLAVNASNNQVLIAGVFIPGQPTAQSGVFRSVDGGVNWTPVLSGAPATEVFFDPSNPAIAYAALGTPCLTSAQGICTDSDPENGIYKSTDMGGTWVKFGSTQLPATGLPAANLGRIELAIAPSTSSTMYASIADSSTGSDNLLGVFKTTNGGALWTQLTNAPDFCTPQCWYDQVIRVHPNNANVVYVGGSATTDSQGFPNYLSQSTDGGNSWISIVSVSTVLIPHVDQHAMAFGISGQTVRLYVGNDGGVWHRDVSNPTSQASWTNINGSTLATALGLTQHYPGLAIHPSNENIALSGSQDNDTHRYSGSLLWQQIGPGCDGGWSVIDNFVPSTWYLTCQGINIFKNVQNGARNSAQFFDDFEFADLDIFRSGDSAEFIAPFIADSSVPDRLYFGTFRVWQTNNGGRSWQAISPDVSGGTLLETIAVAPSDPNVVYAGSATGIVQRTLNAGSGTGAVWTNVTGTGLPTRFITQIAVHPTSPDTVYVAFSGFGSCAGCDGMGHIFRSTTGGIAWIDISGNLPDTPVNDIVVDPNDLSGNTLYIGTDVGVFFTTNGGASWSTLMTGLPNVAVFSLKLHPASRILRAATHGRSVWDLQLPGLPPYHLRSISPTTAAAGTSTDVALVAIGAGFTALSVVEFNGTPLVTIPDTVNPTTQLNATIPAALLASGGVPRIRVNDPSLGLTSELPFTVTGDPPFLTSINPTSAMQGSGDTTITLMGTNFVAGSVARFTDNNFTTTDLNTTFISSTQLQATIPASLLTTGRSFRVTVFNPPPGGGEHPRLTDLPVIFSVIGPPPPNDNFVNAIVITGTSFSDFQNNSGATTEPSDPNPSSISTCPQAGRNFSIWYRYTPTSNVTVTVDTGASQYDTVLSVWKGTALGSLTGVACNDDAFFAGGPSALTVTLTAGNTYNFMITGFGPQDAGDTEFTFSVAAPPPNDHFASATAVNSAAFVDGVNSALATTATNDPTPGCTSGASSNGRAKSIWWRFTPATNTTVDASTTFSSYDTILSVWTGSAGSLTSVACNDDSGGAVQSTVSFPATANTTYYFMVTAWEGDGGSTVFAIFSGAGPAGDFSMSTSPSGISVTRGQSGTSTITVSAVAGFSGSVTLTCSGVPSRSTCALNPTSVTVGANPGSSTLTITTTAGASVFAPPPVPVAPVPFAVWWFAALLAVLAAVAWRRKSPSWRWVGASVLLLVLALALMQSACGGGGDGGGNPPPPGTPPGTYTLTVTGTSGTLSRTTAVTLTVN